MFWLFLWQNLMSRSVKVNLKGLVVHIHFDEANIVMVVE